jgi:uncharacterized lipoprotein YmbA
MNRVLLASALALLSACGSGEPDAKVLHLYNKLLTEGSGYDVVAASGF